jgi:lipopolysaccharide export system permease protein
MFQALRLADEFIRRGTPWGMVAKMTGLMVLSVMPFVLPMAFLIGVLVAFGRLSSDSELVAMKANGISLARLSVPVAALSLVVVALSLGLNMSWVPWGDRLFKSTFIRMTNTGVAASIKEGTFTSGFFNLLIFADRLEPKTQRMQRVFIRDEREPKNPMTVVAREGEILPVKTGGELGSAIMLKLYEGSIHHNENATETYQKIDFSEYKLFLKIEEGADNATLKPRMIPYTQLVQTIKDHADDSPYRREFVAELWRRYAVALSPLLFAFLGIGFGTVRTRAVRAGAALVAIVTVVAYYSLQAAATVAAQKSYLPPAFAMQIPNLVTLLMAAKAFHSASW